MTRIGMLIVSLMLVAGAGCKKDGAPSCDAVVDHTAKLAGMELPAEARQHALDKCAKATADQRSCIMSASKPEDLMKCR